MGMKLNSIKNKKNKIYFQKDWKLLKIGLNRMISTLKKKLKNDFK